MVGQTHENEFSGKVTVITGAASGVGLALAMEADRHGSQVFAVRTDVAKFADLASRKQRTVVEPGEPGLIANNAGITKTALAATIRRKTGAGCSTLMSGAWSADFTHFFQVCKRPGWVVCSIRLPPRAY